MPEVNFKPLPGDFQELVSAFMKHVEQSERYIADFERCQYNGTREKAVIYCLRHAVDLAKGCLAIAKAELPDSLTTLRRAVLETFFWARYVTMSEENAQEFADSTMNELKRITRKNLTAGYAKIYGIKIKDDQTKEFLNSSVMKTIPKRISLEKAAELGGLKHVYTIVYGFDSMIAHGRAFDLRTESDIKSELCSSISEALGAFQGVEIITADWIIHRKQTPRETLVRMFGV